MNHQILSDLRRRRQAGQTAVIVALTFVVLIAFAGLAIDGGHVYLVNRRSQNATAAAALAAAKQLAKASAFLTGPPPSFSDPAVKAAHDLAYANGFPTSFDGACTSGNGTTFTASWYAGGSCGSTSFVTRVTVNAPPTGTMSRACQAAPYNCLQVIITQKIENYLMGVLGVPVTYSTTSAVAYAQPPQNSYNGPPTTALWALHLATAALPGLVLLMLVRAIAPRFDPGLGTASAAPTVITRSSISRAPST